MAGLGNFLCELTAFAPTVYLRDIRAVIDEIVARGVAGTDPVIRGPYGPVGLARANCGFF